MSDKYFVEVNLIRVDKHGELNDVAHFHSQATTDLKAANYVYSEAESEILNSVEIFHGIFTLDIS